MWCPFAVQTFISNDQFWGHTLREGFPRITSAMFPGGIDKVRYTISLPECEAFRVELAALATAVAGATDDT